MDNKMDNKMDNRCKPNVVLHKFNFVINEHEHSDGTLSLETKYISNGDSSSEQHSFFVNQNLKLQSNCNSAEFQLYGATLTPTILRKLANKLEEAEFAARGKLIEIEQSDFQVGHYY